MDWQLISWISEIDRFDAPWSSIEKRGTETQLTPKEKSILTFIGNHPGCKSGDITKKLGIPNPTVKRILTKLVEINLIEKYGTGPGTNYSIK
ncbi:MAG: MarR family winged helix-turn-helix transcriptional regulator [Bacteroidales bacterium]|nr:MarR family winged helix-turn-helix transcriptional regulator [Bacteroidales bacterium]MCF8337566.1 MarR family winged helix-turn-helix transcriptional regulator [Bacteroidales bacterium]